MIENSKQTDDGKAYPLYLFPELGVVHAEPGNDGSSPTLLVLDGETLLQTAGNVEPQPAPGLRALDRAPAIGLTDVAFHVASSTGNPGAVDAVPPLGVAKEDLRHEEGAHDVGPTAVRGGLHRSSLHRAQAAAAAARLLFLLLLLALSLAASQTEPVSFRDRIDQGIAVARGMDHEIASVAEHNGIHGITVRAPANRTDNPIILVVLLLVFILLFAGFFIVL